MQAIHKESFAIKSLQAVQAQYAPVDLAMLERTAHALELVGRLVDSEVDLVFKGGNPDSMAASCFEQAPLNNS